MTPRDYQIRVAEDARTKVAMGARRLVIQAETGSGKAQPLSTKVLTPTGWALMGELAAGTRIIGSDGMAHTVLAIYPQGTQPVYQVTFSDGSQTRCTDDHLWAVRSKLQKWRGHGYRVLPLHQIRQSLYVGDGFRWFLPVVAPVQFDPVPVPMDPYLLGILLGNGGLKYRVSLSSPDPHVIEAARRMVPPGVRVEYRAGVDYDITCGRTGGQPNPVLDVLRDLGIFGKRSVEKFIPDLYLYNSVAIRLSLLHGLMDTDGWVQNGTGYFGTSSPRLAEDVLQLVRSLGGCTEIKDRPEPHYTYRGELRTGKPAYRVRVNLAGINPFSTPVKANGYNLSPKYGQTKAIAFVAHVGDEECQCLLVDAPDSLYVTDDYVLTHNTVIAAMLIKSCYDKGLRSLFVARGRELVNQTSGTLSEWGVNHGLLMRGEDAFPPARVQVASKDTLISWCHRHKKMEFPEAHLVIFDECHESLSKTWVKVMQAYPGAVLIGLTATPARADGRGLGSLYDGMVQAIPTSQLILEKWIVPTRVYAPTKPNLKGVKVERGDYNTGQLSRRMNTITLVGNVVQHWKAYGENRLSIVYACDRAHGLALSEQFLASGVIAGYVDGDTPSTERDHLIETFKADGPMRVIVNVAVLKQGVDIPAASCCVLARPTRSLILYRQAIGRVRRPHPGKENALVLDHAGAVYEHGMPDEDVPWDLDVTTRVQERHKANLKEKGRLPIVCKKCQAEFAGRRTCPQCGTEVKRNPRDVQTKAGKLVQVTDELLESPRFLEDCQRFWNKCLAVMAYKGRSAGAAAHMFYGRYKKWPWELKDKIDHVPPAGTAWKQPVREVFPGFVR